MSESHPPQTCTLQQNGVVKRRKKGSRQLCKSLITFSAPVSGSTRDFCEGKSFLRAVMRVSYSLCTEPRDAWLTAL